MPMAEDGCDRHDRDERGNDGMRNDLIVNEPLAQVWRHRPGLPTTDDPAQPKARDSDVCWIAKEFPLLIEKSAKLFVGTARQVV